MKLAHTYSTVQMICVNLCVLNIRDAFTIKTFVNLTDLSDFNGYVACLLRRRSYTVHVY